MPVQAQDFHAVLEGVKNGLESVKQHAEAVGLTHLVRRYEEATKNVHTYLVSKKASETIPAREISPKISSHLTAIAEHAAGGNVAGVIAHSQAVLMELPGEPVFRPEDLPLAPRRGANHLNAVMADSSLPGGIIFRPEDLP